MLYTGKAFILLVKEMILVFSLKKLFNNSIIKDNKITEKPNQNIKEFNKRKMLVMRKIPGTDNLELGADIMDVALPIIQNYFGRRYNDGVGAMFSDFFACIDSALVVDINLYASKNKSYPKGKDLANITFNTLYDFDLVLTDKVKSNQLQIESYIGMWKIFQLVFEELKDCDEKASLLYDAVNIYISEKTRLRRAADPIRVIL